jgi:hypothetical protein
MKTDLRKNPITACKECDNYCEGLKMDVCGEALRIVHVEERVDFENKKDTRPSWCPMPKQLRIVDDCHWCHNYIDIDDLNIHECFLLKRYVKGGEIDPECPLEKLNGE